MRKHVFFSLVLLACGSRTALLIDDSPPLDASSDASKDGGRDGSRDARDEDVSFPDVIPPLDVVTQDVIVPNDCADAAITLIYLFSEAGDLLSFYPPTLTLKTIGKVSCPTMATPNSMAVDHLGVAYANLVGAGPNDGEMWKLSTATAACTATTYKAQSGFVRFGMGFVGDQDGGENLYIADTQTNPNGALGQVDINTFKLGVVGTFTPPLPRCELSGTGDGKLFAFCVNNAGSTLALVDQKTAKVIGSDTLVVGGQVAFAFAYWGGVFWMFTGSNGSTVTKYDPNTKSETTVLKTSQTIVGAGVSTCAPLK